MKTNIPNSHEGCPASKPPVPGRRRVGVIVVTWNKRSHVLALLDSLSVLQRPDWHVLVVDNASTDGTLDAVCQRHPWVEVVLTQRNLGGTGGFNLGLMLMTNRGGFDYLWLLDNDVVVEPQALDVLIAVLEANPDAAVAGSHMIRLGTPHCTNEIGGFFDPRRGRLLLHQYLTPSWIHRGEVHDVDYVAACSLLVRAPLVRTIGLWDNLFIHLDDVDWCLRFREAGHRILACAASRIHHVAANAKRVTWVLYYDIRNRLYLIEKHRRPSAGFYLVDIAREMLHAIRDTLGGKAFYARLARFGIADFLAGHFGARPGLANLIPPMNVPPGPLLHNARTVWALSVAARPDELETTMAEACRGGARVILFCPDASERQTAPAPLQTRVPMPATPGRRLCLILETLIRSGWPDVFVTNVDQPCGFLALCARRTVLLSDHGAMEVPCRIRRVLQALMVPIQWAPLIPAWGRFLFTRNAVVRAGAVAWETSIPLSDQGPTPDPLRAEVHADRRTDASS